MIKEYVFSLVCVAMEPMPSAARSRLFSWVSAWAGIFARSAVIGVVRVGNCLYRVSSASFLCLRETVIFHYLYRRSKHIDKQIIKRYGANVSPCCTLATMSM